MEQIVCSYFKTIYQVDANNVSIALYRMNGNCVTVTGHMLPTTKKLKYTIRGEWLIHPKYGKQFVMKEGYDIQKPSTVAAIKDYLCSGAVKGIGKKTAEKIVAEFKEDTFKVMDEDIDRLLKIPGVTKNKLEQIKESYEANFAGREAIITLGKHGISPKLASKVYQKYKRDTLYIIKEKPYLFSYIKGITFPIADAIAEDSEKYEMDYERFRTCANYVLSENEMNGLKDLIGDRCAGSLSMTAQDFGNAMLKLLRRKHMTGAKILEYTCDMIREGLLKVVTDNGQKYLYKAGIYHMQYEMAGHLARLTRKETHNYDINAYIVKAEKHLHITLSEEQKEAVRKAFDSSLSLIIGGAGTGKTTIIKVIVFIYKELFGEKELTFLAPTGKAAHRITESSGYAASTIHSRLNIGTEQLQDVIPTETKIEEGLVIVDEMSMLGARIAYALFSSISENCKIILCGDDEQLQSVDAGAVLRDMIQAKELPVTVLNNVYRQNADSAVYINSHKIRNGISKLQYGKGFVLHEIASTAEMEEEMVRAYLQKIKEVGIENVMMLAPFKERDAGVNQLNDRVQSVLHPNEDNQFKCSGKTFRLGDIVMQLKNTEALVNGDTGVVVDIESTEDEKSITVQFENGRRTYTEEDADELTLAYAYTIHKSQGSEAKCVIMCLHKMHSVMLKRNIIYTAITRAKEEVIIFGQQEAVERAINTVDKAKRNTHLCQMMNQYMFL